MPDNPVRFEFLKKLHLFRGLSDAELASIAEELQEETYPEGGLIFEENAVADSLYFLYQGRVDITRKADKKQVKITSLVKGDYFGEQGLLKGTRRNASVRAQPGTVVLMIYRTQLKQLLARAPALRKNLEIMMYSRRLASEVQFDWLSENEVIYFLSRKHRFLLVRALVLPVAILIPIFSSLVLAYLFNSAGFGLVGGFSLILDLAWAVWRIFDWGNDYYIVTNQRVIWLEKVVALYDSRIEANVGTILSVSTETDYWARFLDYGTVVVRTFTGQIRLDYVRHPRQAAAMIEEYWNRAKESGRMANEETMKQAIRGKMGIPIVAAPVVPAAPPPRPAKPKKISPFSAWWANAFRMRTDDGNNITYHKHIYGFIRDSFLHMIGIVVAFSSFFIWPFVFDIGMPLWLVTFVIFGIFVLFGLVVYEYLDWKNDIYQVTPEQIIDVTRKPFGTEDRKAAPLENILSTEYKRRGFIGMMLNFGTVYIMVGGAQFLFEDVADPPSVQQDIVHRQQGRLQKKKDVESFAERERMAEWLAVYHRTLEDINREKRTSNPSNPE